MRNNKLFIKFSYVLNVVFLCGSIFAFYKIYPNLKSKYFINRQEIALTTADTIPTVFYDASKFKIIGQLPNTETYARLPMSAKNIVQAPIWDLSKHSAGVSIRFRSNTSLIKIRWTLHHNGTVTNMTPIASKGLDLYAYVDHQWQFVGIAKPTGTLENEATVITGMETKDRDYLLNLPLYDGVSSLEIGIAEGSSISKPTQKIIDTTRPIVFYGTSITQGASASRPGLTYAARLKRYFNKEVINLGFSGNGRFEKEIAEYIMTAKPSVIVLDCTPNSTSAVIKENLPKTIDFISSIDDTIPIVLVESIIRDFAYFKKDNNTAFATLSFIQEQNNALQEVYQKKIKTKKNIIYVSHENLIGKDREATIDGIHFNDLGHYRAYELLQQELQKLINL
jgi:lysophospholipase L1-like esterase